MVAGIRLVSRAWAYVTVQVVSAYLLPRLQWQSAWMKFRLVDLGILGSFNESIHSCCIIWFVGKEQDFLDVHHFFVDRLFVSYVFSLSDLNRIDRFSFEKLSIKSLQPSSLVRRLSSWWSPRSATCPWKCPSKPSEIPLRHLNHHHRRLNPLLGYKYIFKSSTGSTLNFKISDQQQF